MALKKWIESLKEVNQINIELRKLVDRIPYISLIEANDGLANAAERFSLLLGESINREFNLEKELRETKVELALANGRLVLANGKLDIADFYREKARLKEVLTKEPAQDY